MSCFPASLNLAYRRIHTLSMHCHSRPYVLRQVVELDVLFLTLRANERYRSNLQPKYARASFPTVLQPLLLIVALNPQGLTASTVEICFK